jgi:hypothetical protein
MLAIAVSHAPLSYKMLISPETKAIAAGENPPLPVGKWMFMA